MANVNEFGVNMDRYAPNEQNIFNRAWQGAKGLLTTPMGEHGEPFTGETHYTPGGYGVGDMSEGAGIEFSNPFGWGGNVTLGPQGYADPNLQANMQAGMQSDNIGVKADDMIDYQGGYNENQMQIPGNRFQMALNNFNNRNLGDLNVRDIVKNIEEGGSGSDINTMQDKVLAENNRKFRPIQGFFNWMKARNVDSPAPPAPGKKKSGQKDWVSGIGRAFANIGAQYGENQFKYGDF